MQLNVFAHQDPDEHGDRGHGHDEVVPQRMSAGVMTDVVADVSRRQREHGQPAIRGTTAPGPVPATKLSAFQRPISVSMYEAGSGRENR